MATGDDRTTGDAKDITLRDVVVYMEHMEQRLSSKIETNTRNIEANTRGIAQNTAAIQDLRLRIDVLDEDLTATIKDTIKIRQHVGMASADDD